ncbi:MAG: TlpA disulfide reductase family protein [Pseudomonadota bacterium]
MVRVVWTALIIVTVLLTAVRADAEVVVGETPPDLLGTVDGEAIRLSDNPDKVRIVTFWASWCPPCRKELPILAQIQAKVGTDRLQVYAVNSREDRRTYRKLSRKLDRLSDMVFLHDRDGAISDSYGLQGLPLMIILDRSGNVAHIHRGYSDSIVDQLIAELNLLLAT